MLGPADDSCCCCQHGWVQSRVGSRGERRGAGARSGCSLGERGDAGAKNGKVPGKGRRLRHVGEEEARSGHGGCEHDLPVPRAEGSLCRSSDSSRGGNAARVGRAGRSHAKEGHGRRCAAVDHACSRLVRRQQPLRRQAGRQAGRQASAQRGQQSIRREAVRDEADRHSTANGSHLPAVDECARQGHSQRSGRAALCKRPKQPPRAQCCAARLRTHGHNTIRFKRGREPRRSDAAFDSLDSVQHLLRRGDVNGGIESRLRSTRSLVSRAHRRARSAEQRRSAPRDAMGPVMTAGSPCAASCAHGQRETGRSSQRPAQESKAPRRSPRAERRSWRARRGRADSCGGPLQRPARGCRPCRAQTTRRLLRQPVRAEPDICGTQKYISAPAKVPGPSRQGPAPEAC